MSRVNSFNVTYDRDGDVLYISKRHVPASRGIEDQHGIVWRYDSEGELIGATVIDFYHRWFGDKDRLAAELSRGFEIPKPQARVVLDHALEN
jgi:uncharacterized protein YuzE